MFSDGESYALNQHQNNDQGFSLGKVEQAKSSILERLMASDYAGFAHLNSLLRDVITSSNRKLILEVAGMTGVGKSALIGQLMNNLGASSRIYTTGLSTGIQTARRREELTSAQGRIEPDEYLAVGRALNRARWAFLQHVKGPAVLVEETNIESESFDPDGNRRGTMRANIESLRDINNVGADLYMAFVRAPEAFRQGNVALKEKMIIVGKEAGPGGIHQAQAEAGIIEDRKVGSVLMDGYVNSGNPATSRQQFTDTAFMMYLLAKEGRADMTFNTKLLRLSPEEFALKLKEHPRIFTENLARHHQELALGILGPDRMIVGRTDTLRYGTFVNTKLPKRGLRWEFRGLKEERDLLRNLQIQAAETRDPSLQYDLDYFKLPPLEQ